MLQFVDSFFCTYNNDTQNMVLRFRQEEPFQDSNSKSVQVQTTEVANIIMSKTCAEQLAAGLQQLLSENTTSAD